MLRFNRKFLLWRYTVGHQQLLLRSVKSERDDTRIDILFKAVEQIRIPTTLENIVVEEIGAGRLFFSHLSWLIAHTHDAKIFSVSCDNAKGFVVAGAIAHHEDDGEYDTRGKFDDSMML